MRCWTLSCSSIRRKRTWEKQWVVGKTWPIHGKPNRKHNDTILCRLIWKSQACAGHIKVIKIRSKTERAGDYSMRSLRCLPPGKRLDILGYAIAVVVVGFLDLLGRFRTFVWMKRFTNLHAKASKAITNLLRSIHRLGKSSARGRASVVKWHKNLECSTTQEKLCVREPHTSNLVIKNANLLQTFMHSCANARFAVGRHQQISPSLPVLHW